MAGAKTRKEPSTRSADPKTAALETAGAVLGAGVGLALGGPAGALIAAGTGPIAVYAARVFTRLSAHFWLYLRNSLTSKGVDEENFLKSLTDDEGKEAVFLRIVRAAFLNVDPTHLKILAQAAANLITADALHASIIAHLAEILASLNSLHIRVLKMIADFNKAHPESRGVTPDMLLEEFKSEEMLIRSIVRKLELDGLILDNARLDRSISGVFWEISELGDWLLKIETAATEATQ